MVRLSTHLRDRRRRADLSHDELAFLLGSRGGADALHYERSLHAPTLRAAIAYEVIFRATLRELFAGTYEKVERDVMKRATKLLHRLPVEHVSQEKVRSLITITDPPIEDLRWDPIAKP
jgi:hypothetical protein